jgi:hypothetical protein
LAGEDSVSDPLPTFGKVDDLSPSPFDEKGNDDGTSERNGIFLDEYIASVSLADDKPKKEVPMATAYEPNQIVELEELLMSLVVQQRALIRLLVKKGIFSTEEFSEMATVVGKEVKPMSIRLPVPPEGR